mmetsp:Transcript_11838/g.28051  ORF Transcript_11838/g.28051 Transcript_11838/m.28051 type:complete len:99 (-) Transcript_11838:795-1091(-)
MDSRRHLLRLATGFNPVRALCRFRSRIRWRDRFRGDSPKSVAGRDSAPGDKRGRSKVHEIDTVACAPLVEKSGVTTKTIPRSPTTRSRSFVVNAPKRT